MENAIASFAVNNITVSLMIIIVDDFDFVLNRSSHENFSYGQLLSLCFPEEPNVNSKEQVAWTWFHCNEENIRFDTTYGGYFIVHLEFSLDVRMLNISCKKDVWILYVRIDHPFAIGANKVVIEVMAFIVVDYFLIIYLQHTSFATSTNHKLSYSIFRTLIARIQEDVLLVLIDKARILCRQRSPLILASN